MFASLRLGMYDTIKTKIAGGSGDTSLLTKIVTGLVTGTIAMSIANPTDLVKIRM